MQAQDVEEILENSLPECEVSVKVDSGHYFINVIGDMFAGMSRVKKQQTVYGVLNEHIASGAMHALHIKTYTPDEWQAAQGE